MKYIFSFLPKMCMMMLLLGNVVGAHAVNITYSLTTHPVFNYSYTITSSISVNAGSDLLDNMPQDLWRKHPPETSIRSLWSHSFSVNATISTGSADGP